MSMDYSGLWSILAARGWSTYTIRKKGLLGEATLTAIRSGKPISGATIERLCIELECQPGDLMQHIKSGKEDEEDV